MSNIQSRRLRFTTLAISDSFELPPDWRFVGISPTGAGVTITASTKIIDVTQKEATEYVGRVPKNSVVIPGARPKEFAAGTYNIPCAIIIGQRSESTDKKTSLTSALRDFDVSV